MTIMKLIRYATIFLKSLRAECPGFRLGFGDVEAAIGAVQEFEMDTKAGHRRVLVAAGIDLRERPERTGIGRVIVPEEPRCQSEAAIESVADVLAVLNHCPRTICSPRPFAALAPENDAERRWLDESAEFEGGDAVLSSMCNPDEVTPESMMLMSDRTDGAALMAEALAIEHATGRFREFIRLFERAFALPPSKFEKKLTQFLEGADLGYDRAEVRRWVAFRNPATHADDLARPFLVFESHVRPVIARMQQAAFDVLYNKKVWRDPSRERRNVWTPTSASLSDSGNRFRATQNPSSDVMQIRLFDPFHAFAMDIGPPLRLGPELWSKWSGGRYRLAEMIGPEGRGGSQIPADARGG
jgi:hypothetical protein